MNWLARALIGPCLWAVAFSGIYAVHGLGCAWDWPARSAPLGNLQHFVLITLWLVCVAAAIAVFRFTPSQSDTGARIARAGSWIGLVSILLSLAPVLGLSTCPAGWVAFHVL